MKIYVGRWSLLPPEWEGINGLYEKSEKEIADEISRQVTKYAKIHGIEDNLIAIYTPAEFEETFNGDENTLIGGTYFVKFFEDGKSVIN